MIELFHLEDAKVVAVEGEQDDRICEPRGDAHRPRGELVVEQEPPRAAAVRSADVRERRRRPEDPWDVYIYTY